MDKPKALVDAIERLSEVADAMRAREGEEYVYKMQALQNVIVLMQRADCPMWVLDALVRQLCQAMGFTTIESYRKAINDVFMLIGQTMPPGMKGKFNDG